MKKITPPIPRSAWIPPTLLFCALLFAGCAGIPIKKASLRNLSHQDLIGVHIEHLPSQPVVSGLNVPKDTSRELEDMAGRKLQGKKAHLTWQQSDGQELEAELDLPARRTVEDPRRPHELVYRIFPDGRVSIHLEP